MGEGSLNMSLRGSQTERNLLAAYAGESQARNRYLFYAKQAKKDGYESIGALFAETADQEASHAKCLFRHLEGGEVEITATYAAGVIGTTLENLRAAAAGEEHEWTEMYPAMADTAEAEGFTEIAAAFRAIAIAEKQHGKRYKDLADNLEAGRVFRRDGKVVWRCRNCGYLHEGEDAPYSCPACLHPKSYFELLGENW